ncbi:hypothetical protein OsI_07320 [Oryza sativa Indica Group]|uniref:Uncharacterized protein n=1 Tax=Oryza sativa subsp. indica TaxID=39946 RepID=A2X546_ORYSI|nr:hypothetical protein OsI_07320 [Oryza sativa Indica Group]
MAKEVIAQAATGLAAPSQLPTGIDPDDAFSVCVQFGAYTAKLDNGSCVDVARKCEEWIVDYKQCTLESLEKDFAARVKWGSCQSLVVSGYDTCSGEETKLMDNMDLAHALYVRKNEKKLFLFVDIEDKPSPLVVNSSCVSEDNDVVMDSVAATRQGDGQDSSCQQSIDCGSVEIASIAPQQEPQHVIDWETLEIAPILEQQIGSSMPVMEEDEMYAFLGLMTEDERVEQARVEAEKVRVEAEKGKVEAEK